MAIRRTNIKFPRTLTLKDSLSHSRDSLHELTQSIRLTAVAVENLSAASGVAYRELGAILAFFFTAPYAAPKRMPSFPKQSIQARFWRSSRSATRRPNEAIILGSRCRPEVLPSPSRYRLMQ